MTNRWAILALLFCARMIMAMQFQLVGALSPALEVAFGLSAVEIGVAIGLYFAPGVIFAMPGGLVAARFGEVRIATLGLILMAVGGALMGSSANWSVFLAGQLIAGIGGVAVNVLMTKMVADSFRDGQLATALSIFINSWPVGIALGLVVLPFVAGSFGVSMAIFLVALLALVFAMAVPLLYRAPVHVGTPGQRALPRHDLALALSAGLIWGAFNAGLGVVFGFGTALLTDAGATPESAARQTSLVLWALAIIAPIGGLLSDRQARPEIMIGGGLVVMAALTVLAASLDGVWWMLILIGAVAGLVAGPIMSLPARSLSDGGKAAGMGVFFTVYYAAFLATPPLAGWVAEALGTLNGAFLVGGAMHGVALAALVGFARARRSGVKPHPSP